MFVVKEDADISEAFFIDKEEVPFVTASRVFIYVSIDASLCAGNSRREICNEA